MPLAYQVAAHRFALASVVAMSLAASPRAAPSDGDSAPTKVEDLGSVPGALHTPEGRRAFQEQMVGSPGEDGLGTSLPEALSRDVILRLVVPPGVAPAEPVSLVGAVPWPAKKDAFVAIVCSTSRAFNPRVCDLDPDRKEHAWLAVLERTPAGVRLLARTEVPFVPIANWSEMKEQPADSTVSESEILRFDLAPYRIAPDEVAIGLRTASNEGYSGGGATFESLHLFRVQGSRLVEVFSHPMAWMKMVAGAWHEDHTREHFFSDGAMVLVVGEKSSNGFFELSVRPRRGGGSRFLARWNKSQGKYESRRVK